MPNPIALLDRFILALSSGPGRHHPWAVGDRAVDDRGEPVTITRARRYPCSNVVEVGRAIPGIRLPMPTLAHVDSLRPVPEA